MRSPAPSVAPVEPRAIDDLVLHLRGLVAVRELRERGGADDGELEMYGNEIARVRQRLQEVGQTAA